MRVLVRRFPAAVLAPPWFASGCVFCARLSSFLQSRGHRDTSFAPVIYLHKIRPVPALLVRFVSRRQDHQVLFSLASFSLPNEGLYFLFSFY